MHTFLSRALVLVVGLSTLHAARAETPACTITELPTGDEPIVGAWREPQQDHAQLAIAERAAAQSWIALVPTVEPRVPGRRLSLPSKGVVQRVWRSAAGELLVSWRSGKADRLALSPAGSIHLGKLAGDKLVEVPFQRPAHAHIERMLGPVDDPSESRLAALMMWTQAPKGAGGDSPGVVYLSTASSPRLEPAGKIAVMVGGSNLDDTAYVGAERTLLSGENGVGAAIVEGETYHQLGPKGPFDLGRFKVDRLAQADGAGFPRVAMLSPQAGLALWLGSAEPGVATLYAQPIDGHGAPTAEPVAHALRISRRSGIVPDALRDVQVQGGNVFVVLQTLADDAHSPRTSTLLRLDGNGRAIASQSIALEAPLLTGMPDGVLLWTSHHAMRARCPR